jgi:predicted acyltransferase
MQVIATYTQSLFRKIDVLDVYELAAQYRDRTMIYNGMGTPWKSLHEVRKTPASKNLCLEVIIAREGITRAKGDSSSQRGVFVVVGTIVVVIASALAAHDANELCHKGIDLEIASKGVLCAHAEDFTELL